jgi:hypothetical protein
VSYDARRRRAGRFAGVGSADLVDDAFASPFRPRLALSVATRSVVGGRASTSTRLNLLTGDLLLDRLQETLPVLVLVVLWLELGFGERTDQPVGERQGALWMARFGGGRATLRHRWRPRLSDSRPLKEVGVALRTEILGFPLNRQR